MSQFRSRRDAVRMEGDVVPLSWLSPALSILLAPEGEFIFKESDDIVGIEGVNFEGATTTGVVIANFDGRIARGVGIFPGTEGMIGDVFCNSSGEVILVVCLGVEVIAGGVVIYPNK